MSLNTTENEDYGPIISNSAGTLSSSMNYTCHSVAILDDGDVEPPEIFVVSITATGPTQEFIDLFNISLPQAVVQIVDNDSECQ